MKTIDDYMREYKDVFNPHKGARDHFCDGFTKGVEACIESVFKLDALLNKPEPTLEARIDKLEMLIDDLKSKLRQRGVMV